MVEYGTAIGYSGLWSARELLQTGKGSLITIELDPDRADQARTNFTQAGVANLVEVRVGEAEQVLDNLDSGVTVDFAHIGRGESKMDMAKRFRSWKENPQRWW